MAKAPRPNPPPKERDTSAIRAAIRSTRSRATPQPHCHPAQPTQPDLREIDEAVVLMGSWLQPLSGGAALMILIEEYDEDKRDLISPLVIGGELVPVRFTFVSLIKNGKLLQASAVGPACFSDQLLPARRLKILAPPQTWFERDV